MSRVNIIFILTHIVNQQCEFEEFRDIQKNAFLQDSKNPDFKWKFRIEPFLEDRQNEDITPMDFVTSKFFEEEVKRNYN